MKTSSAGSPRRRVQLAIALIVTFFFVVFVAALIIINVAVLPGATATLEEAVSREGLALDIGGTSYLPLRGLVFRKVEIQVLAPDTSPARSAVVRIPAIRTSVRGGLLNAPQRIPSLELPPFSPADAAGWVLGAAAALADGGLLPRQVVLRQPSAVLASGTQKIVIATGRMVVRHHHRNDEIRIHATASDGGPFAGAVTIGYGARELSGRIDLHPGQAALGPLNEGNVSGYLDFVLTDDETMAFDGGVSLSETTWTIPAVTTEPIEGLDLNYAFSATLHPHAEEGVPWPGPPESSRILTNESPWAPPDHPAEGRLVFSAGALRVNDVHGVAIPEVHGLFGGQTLAVVRVHLPPTAVDVLLSSVPPAIGGAVTRTKTAGTLGWDLSVWVPVESVVDMVWNTEAMLADFAVLEIDPSVNVYRLNDEFLHTIVDDNAGFRRTVLIPPARPASMEWMLMHSEHSRRQIVRSRAEDLEIAEGRPEVRELAAASLPGVTAPARDQALTAGLAPDPAYHYVYVDDMSPWVVRAILTAEDGDFFFYGGINPVTLADAIALNVAAGEILYGASTISMQLVKMVFLDQERVFSRKAQELFLVYLMEHEVPVPKERILELYINLAEFGPGIFGIHDAARIYFGKHPRDLTAGEAAWLASILPSPKGYYEEFEDGRVSNESFGRMIDLFDIMRERGRMHPTEYRAAISTRPRFAPPE